MKYRVVLIDDNKNTVLSLQYGIDWESLNIEVIGTAYDGKSGCDLIKRTDPDIIITDISMPYVDGLTMVEDSGHDPDRKILIIISGYDNFQYASRAIKLSAFDYILKPIDDSELYNTLQRAVNKLEKRQSEIHRSENVIKKDITFDLLNQKETRIRNYFQLADEPQKTAYIMIGSPKTGYSRAFLEKLEDSDIFRDNTIVSVFLGQYLILLILLEDMSEEEQRRRLQQLKIVLLESGETAAIGISSGGTTDSCLYELYLDAYENMLQGGKEESRSKIFQSVNAADLQSAAAECAHMPLGMQSFDAIRNKFNECTGGSRLSLQIMTVNFTTDVRSEHRNWAPYLNHLSLEAAGISSFYIFTKWLTSYLKAIDDICEKEKGKTDLVIRAQNYIHDHCTENLRLEKVAEQLFVSPNYLSSLISRETGKTFQQHLIDERITLAKMLLNDSRMTIDEISSAVGYKDYLSFYNVFKKHEGKTPREYRLHGNGQ